MPVVDIDRGIRSRSGIEARIVVVAQGEVAGTRVVLLAEWVWGISISPAHVNAVSEYIADQEKISQVRYISRSVSTIVVEIWY